MNLVNQEVRKYAKSKDVCLWEVADYLGVSEPTMTRKMRRELSDSERDNILSIIDQISVEKNKGE